jgi:small subunit ribosomal protein S7
MNKNISKTSSKPCRSYILSDIRQQRTVSPQRKSSLPPKSSVNIRNFVNTQGSLKTFSGKYSPRKNFPKTFSKNISPKSSEKPSFSKTSWKSSTKILPKKKGEITREISRSPVVKSTESTYACLFVKNLLKKGEVFGTSLMNRFTRFMTKDGKKSQASYFMARVRTILAGFEADKKDSSEVSLKSMKSLRQPEHHDKSLKIPRGPELVKSSQDIHDKINTKYSTYKSRKLSQFLSRQKVDSSETVDKSSKIDVKSLKKNIQKNGGYSPLSPRFLIEQAISHVKPFVEVKKVRVAGSTYQVPAILEKHRQENYAIKWILQSALERHKKNPFQAFEYCLAFEIYEASKKQGQARIKRNELHKLAESHRAFAHFRWW